MEGSYPIFIGEESVGTALVSREGLYYRLDCQCRLRGKEIFKIYAECENGRLLLGTPTPEGDCYRLRTRLPAKRFSGETPRFCLRQEIFIPVRPDEPFLHLKDLKNAVFAVRNGESGIIIAK